MSTVTTLVNFLILISSSASRVEKDSSFFFGSGRRVSNLNVQQPNCIRAVKSVQQCTPAAARIPCLPSKISMHICEALVLLKYQQRQPNWLAFPRNSSSQSSVLRTGQLWAVVRLQPICQTLIISKYVQ